MMRLRTKCHCIDNKPVFHKAPGNRYGRVSIAIIEDVMTMTSTMSLSEKRDIFESHGIDYDNVSLYYKKVIDLDIIWYKQSTLEVLEKLHLPPSFFVNLVIMCLLKMFGLS